MSKISLNQVKLFLGKKPLKKADYFVEDYDNAVWSQLEKYYISVEKWCKETLKGRFYLEEKYSEWEPFPGYDVLFEEKEDKLLFEMTWK